MTTALAVFLVAFVVQYGALKVYTFFLYHRFFSPLRHLPGPTDNFPLLGQLKNLIQADTPIAKYHEWSNTWPHAPFIRYLAAGNQEVLLVNTPEAHKEVFQTYCYDFVKPEFLFRYIGEIAGRGLLFVEGEEHRRQRRVLSRIFSVPSLKRLTPSFQDKAAKLTTWFDRELDGTGKGTVEVTRLFDKMTIDSIGSAILGINLDNLKSQTDPDLNFLKFYHGIFNQKPFAQIVSFVNIQVPIRWLPLAANRDFKHANEQINMMLGRVVAQRAADIERARRENRSFESLHTTTHGGRDLLTMMIQERETIKGTADSLTDHEILQHLLLFMVAGHETTAGGLVWAAFSLATNARVQEKLRAEINGLLAKNPSPGYNEIDALPYLNNFAREVLRLYSPAITTFREAAKDLTICSVPIPKGTVLLASPCVSSQKHQTWGPDADHLRPERWGDELGGSAAADAYAYGAFMHGPRVCIGKQYAYIEFKIVVVELLRRFRLAPSAELDARLTGPAGERLLLPPIEHPCVAFKPRDGLRIDVQRVDGGYAG